MRVLYLVDNSVWARVHLSPVIAQAVRALSETGELATCLPTVLEQGYSARSAHEHKAIVSKSLRIAQLTPTAEIADIAIGLQRKLFEASKGRAVGVPDLQIAATALHYSDEAQTVVVVHYDSDFDHLAALEPAFAAKWIVPRGDLRT